MRFFTFILTLYILILAVKPGLDSILLPTNTEQTCCIEKCTPIADDYNSQDQNQDNEREGKSCNPFQVCGSCAVPILSAHISNLHNLLIITERRFTYQSAYIAQFLSDFWHPPKIV